MSKLTLVAVIRNEAPYILEWLAHHLAVGAEEFVLCVHGSSDGTAKLTRRLAAMGYGVHHKIAVESNDPLTSALAQIADLEEITQADWIGLINVDQFLNIHAGHGGFDDLIGQIDPSLDAIDLTAFPFGAMGMETASDARITETFVQRGEDPTPSKPPVRIAKSLAALTSPKNSETVASNQAQINQYTCKSADNLAMRLMTPLYADEDQILSDWTTYNQNDTPDETIRRYDMWYRKYDRYLRADRRLRLAQKAGINWHKSRADAARETEPLQALLARAKL